MAKVTEAWFQLPDKFDNETAESIADDIVQFIRQRSEKGVGIKPDQYGVVANSSEKDFAKYSESYIKSLDFKIAGKGKNVDLTLSGDMLSSIDYKKIKQRRDRTEILIGVFDKSEVGKAEGNILGTYGDESRPNRRKLARNFMGITKDDLEMILRKYESDNG